jgi:hypothetical protein
LIRFETYSTISACASGFLVKTRGGSKRSKEGKRKKKELFASFALFALFASLSTLLARVEQFSNRRKQI